MALPVDVYMRYVDKDGKVSLFAHRVIGDETTKFMDAKEAEARKDGGTAQQITKERYQQERAEK